MRGPFPGVDGATPSNRAQAPIENGPLGLVELVLLFGPAARLPGLGEASFEELSRSLSTHQVCASEWQDKATRDKVRVQAACRSGRIAD